MTIHAIGGRAKGLIVIRIGQKISAIGSLEQHRHGFKDPKWNCYTV